MSRKPTGRHARPQRPRERMGSATYAVIVASLSIMAGLIGFWITGFSGLF